MSENTIKTLAKEAQDQLSEETNNATILQGPFATRKYEMSSVRLQTTLPELKILNGSAAIVRPGFNQNDTDKTITIPTIFAKINGVPDDIDEYNLFFDEIEQSNGLQALFNNHLSTAEWQLTDEEITELLSDLSAKTLMTSSAWAYTSLAVELQLQIANAIVKTFDSWEFSFQKNLNNKASVLRICLDMPVELLEMHNEVDYPKEVPLLVIKHDDKFKDINRDDVIGYNLMHHLGWDIELYSPNGLGSIENFLSPDSYDEFYYNKMQSTNTAKGHKPSLADKIKLFFKKLKLKFKKLFK